ncbi:tetratricopeptide repeat protein [Stenotrophomonas maltophilia]|uniref:tetratricopeptide repeat protein n=1 Tax=Stenotrophomonas maltophilia TaxID=40324 RepID=UPI000A914CDA|nr:sel1 repeat family protein [Stenotrophomonas maltophilia]
MNRVVHAGGFLLVVALLGCSDQGIQAEGSTDSPSSEHRSSSKVAIPNSKDREGIRATQSADYVADEYPGGAFIVSDFGSPPAGDAIDAIRKLEAAAKAGNSKASYEIYLKLNQCLNVLKDSRAQQTLPSDADTVKNCESLGPDDYAKASEWLSLAAEQGSLGAQLLYASDPEAIVGDASEMLRNPGAVDEYKERSNSYLRKAASQGSVDALSALGDTYMNGIMAPQDLPTSYAYFLTMKRIDPQLLSRRKLEFFENTLTASQIAEANRKSMEIYNECCRKKAR